MRAEEKVARHRLSVLPLAETPGSVSEACRQRGITRTQFYEYKRRYQEQGLEGLKDLPPIRKTHPQTTPPEVVDLLLALESFETSNDMHIAILDAAITGIAIVGVRNSMLERSDQKKLLRERVDRVVVCPEGKILRMELLPPFAYLKEVTDRVREAGGVKRKQKPACWLVNVRAFSR